jgi:putative tryptophan/tyrosine transport system substrate-binding protein
MAEDLVKREVAVIVTAASLGPTRAAKAATSVTPIVFVYGGDPVSDGFVASMNRPSGNVTGLTALTTELAGKRLDLLHKLVPNVETIGFLSGPKSYVGYPVQTAGILAAGRGLGLKIAIVECRDDRDYEAAFATLVRRQAGALILGAFPLPNLFKVIRLAARNAIPTMYQERSFVTGGGLISYGTDIGALYRQAGAQYVARILKGTKPADLPVVQPTRFEMIINLKTAKLLGLDIPVQVLALADEVIE